MAEAIPWTTRGIGNESMRALLVARLPAAPRGSDVEALFHQLDVESNRLSDTVYGRNRAVGRFTLTPCAHWLITARIDNADAVTMFEVQYLSGI